MASECLLLTVSGTIAFASFTAEEKWMVPVWHDCWQHWAPQTHGSVCPSCCATHSRQLSLERIRVYSLETLASVWHVNLWVRRGGGLLLR